jgi:SNF2 family DNA or RNA helicase
MLRIEADDSVVIADEAHRLKEPRGQLGLAMKKIKCPSCFALTGTLIQNRLEEMWSVLDFVNTLALDSSDLQVQRGHAGTLRQWREFVVNPIKQGQRREGMASDVVTSIVSTH